jgi:hypothetical protein
MDEMYFSVIEVDGVSPDEVGVVLFDYPDTGEPPLDSGDGQLCRLHFTPIGGPTEVRVGVYCVGVVCLEYGASQYWLDIIGGRVSLASTVGSGDMNYDSRVNTADIVRLVNAVFRPTTRIH